MSHNPFSPAYKSQLDLSDITRSRKLSEANSKSLNERRQSDDAYVKAMALGTIDGLSKKADAQIQAKTVVKTASKTVTKTVTKTVSKTVISPLRNGRKLTQPPKNARAVLPHDETPGKQAKLSRGRAI